MLVLNPYPQTPFPGKGAILLGLPPLDQARMLAVSRTKPLHDAVAQMADDLYGGGYAPATPFLSTIEIFRQFESIYFENIMLIFSCYFLRHIFSFTQFTKYKIPYRHETVGYQSSQSIIIIFLPAALAL